MRDETGRSAQAEYDWRVQRKGKKFDYRMPQLFHSALLGSTHRTADAADADYFYVPVWDFQAAGTPSAVRARCGCDSCRWFLRTRCARALCACAVRVRGARCASDAAHCALRVAHCVLCVVRLSILTSRALCGRTLADTSCCEAKALCGAA
eukprot:1847746-Pleurochrysis_carterae.AAC.3